MKIFLDTADTEIIKKHFATGLIDGVTTNPTLIRKSGRDPEEVYEELAEEGVRDISMEVVGDSETMTSEGLRLAAKFQEVATIKVPCSPDGLLTCAHLSRDNIKVNVTLIFDAAQAILAAKAGATYVSPFVGRVFDQSFDGIGLIEQISDIFATHGAKTQVLAASIRETYQVAQAFKVGADICTIPSKVFESMFQHVLTDKGLDIFDKDWKKLQSELGTT